MNEYLPNMMDELIAKYVLQEATVKEKQQVEEWAAGSAENQKQLEHFTILWQQSGTIEQHNTSDENLAWQRFKYKIDNQQPAAKVIGIKKYYKWIAAACVLVIAGIWFVTGKKEVSNTPQMVIVNKQTQKNVLVDTLPDSSIVTLNKNSSISYANNFTHERERKITLNGEAFFNVTPNKEKPFIITVNDVEVKVLGTSFNIKSYKGKTEVIVKTGSVQVIKNGQLVTLAPNEKLVTNLNDAAFNKTIVKDKLYNHYLTNEFVCDATPLWRLVEVLNDAFDAEIIIGNTQIKNTPLNATFTNESLSTIINVIATTLQLRVINEKGKIILQ